MAKLLEIPQILLPDDGEGINLDSGSVITFNLNYCRYLDTLLNDFKLSHRRELPMIDFYFEKDTVYGPFGVGAKYRTKITIRCDFKGYEPNTANMVYESVKEGKKLKVILKYC